MFENVTPESVGLDSKWIYKYVKGLNEGAHMHSVLIARGDKILYEAYWKPFDKDFCHRMYSVTKSFVSVAIGLLVDDGLIDLDMPITEYFKDKIKNEPSKYLKKQTVRDMLTMTTAGFGHSWFAKKVFDRTEFYLNGPDKNRPSGTIWEYDSAGSQVLSSLVERITGKRIFDFLNERIFKHLGAFKNATILKTPNGDSWGDSAMICTPRDLLAFARFVLNYGTYEGKRLLSEDYLRLATSRVVDNGISGHRSTLRNGYGYQIWRGPRDSFAFVGMGDQLAICVPDKDLIFVCTADNQGNELAREFIVSRFFEYIVDEIADTPVTENEEYTKKLAELTSSLELYYEKGFSDTQTRQKINNVTYTCEENPMGIKWFRFDFESQYEGKLEYENENGIMILPFKVNKNYFGKFPEEGYSDECGGKRTQGGFKYNCATSLAWTQDNKITLFSQIIDKYFGNVTFSFVFKDNLAYLNCERTAENFLWEYEGNTVCKACV